MKLLIEVDLGNAAMQSAAEAVGAIEEAMRRQASAWDDGPLVEHETGSVRDLNGNTVGRWTVEP